MSKPTKDIEKHYYLNKSKIDNEFGIPILGILPVTDGVINLRAGDCIQYGLDDDAFLAPKKGYYRHTPDSETKWTFLFPDHKETAILERMNYINLLSLHQCKTLANELYKLQKENVELKKQIEKLQNRVSELCLEACERLAKDE